MEESAEQRLAAMGIELPAPAAPAANYVAFMQSGNLLFTAGQLPLKDGKLAASGLVGRDLDTAAGAEAAKWCAVNILAQARMALGSLDRVARIVKITVFVASEPGFTEQHLVANGASDLLVAALGDKGRHARSAVGMAALPLNAPVEVEAVIEVA
ncbi:RidA family protein [Zhengella sp. ZM62]|uniref:RidA family protein n=1 Tax=Zhengella sedimenti TaxID=3390035 RepID=UPI0039748CDA